MSRVHDQDRPAGRVEHTSVLRLRLDMRVVMPAAVDPRRVEVRRVSDIEAADDGTIVVTYDRQERVAYAALACLPTLH